MRSAITIGAVILAIAFCNARVAESSDCDGPERSHERLLEDIKLYIKSTGYDPPRFENEKEWEFDFWGIGCDYMVRVSHLPYTPDAHTVYRISHVGKIIDVVGGG
jgi:hypothetical protein